MRKLVLRLLLLAVLGLTLTGCNTLHGFGQDVEGAGEWLQDTTENW